MPGVVSGAATIGMMIVGAAEISIWAKVFSFVAISIVANELQDEFAPRDEFQPPRGIQLQQNICSTGVSLPLLYGENKIGGNDVFIGTSGTDNKYLWIVQTLGEDECNGIKLDGSGNPLVFINDQQLNDFEDQFGDLVDYTFYSGTSTQTYNTDLYDAFVDPVWGALEVWNQFGYVRNAFLDDNYRRTCYIVWKFTRNADAFPGLPKRTVVLEGRKCFLPDGTKAYSNNAAAVLYDYLRSPFCGCSLGIEDEMQTDEIDYYSYLAAYNYCEQSSKGWEFNGAIFHDEIARDVIDRIRKHFRGSLRWRDGMFYMKYKDLNDETPVMNLTDNHIARDNRGRAMIGIEQMGKVTSFDGLRVAFINTENNVYAGDYVYIGEEEGVIKDLDLTGYQSRELAGAMGSYIMERGTDPYDRIITGTFRDDCMQIERDDLVTLTCTALGYTSQYMRVISVVRHNTGLVTLDLQLEHADLYNDTYDVQIEGYYEYVLPQAKDFDPVTSPERIVELTDGDFNSDNEYFLDVGDLGKTYVIDSNEDVTVYLPSVDEDQVGEKVKFVHYGSGKLTVQAADSDTIDTSSAGGNIYHQEWA